MERISQMSTPFYNLHLPQAVESWKLQTSNQSSALKQQVHLDQD